MRENLTYTMRGDYLLPNLILPESGNPPISRFGRMHRKYLKEHRKATYNRLLLSGKLEEYLTEIDSRANEMMENLTDRMAKTEGVTETLKASDQMMWVQRMNNIRSRAEETVLTELIYA